MPQQNRRPLIRTDLAATDCPTGQQPRPLLRSQYGTGPSEDQHGSLPILECPVGRPHGDRCRQSLHQHHLPGAHRAHGAGPGVPHSLAHGHGGGARASAIVGATSRGRYHATRKQPHRKLDWPSKGTAEIPAEETLPKDRCYPSGCCLY